MNNRLIIWLPEQMGGPWHYCLTGGVSGICQNAVERAALTSLSARETIVIFPGQWARSFALDLPKMRAQDRLSAAGFAIEDRIGSGLKDQHIVLSVDEPSRAGLLSNSKMAHIQKELSSAGIVAAGLYADYDVLKPEGMALGLDDRIVVTGALGYSLDPHVFHSLPDMPDVQNWDVETLSKAVSTDGALNLLQGKYAARRFDGVNLMSLARVASLAAVLGLASLIWTGAQARAAKLQAADMNQQTRQIYELATGASAPSKPALAVTRAKKSGGAVDADFLTLSSALFGAVSDSASVMIESLQYDSGNARLSVRLIYPSFEAASNLEASVRQRGANLQAGGVREQGDRLVGDAILTMEASR